MDTGTDWGQCWEPLGKVLCECRDKQAVRCFSGRVRTLKRDIGLNPTSVIFQLWGPENVIPTPGFSFLNNEVETWMMCLHLEGKFISGGSQHPEHHLPSSLSCPGSRPGLGAGGPGKAEKASKELLQKDVCPRLRLSTLCACDIQPASLYEPRGSIQT